MPDNLIIVESPTKAKIIKRILGNSYEVISSMGHVRDLPANKFGVDIENSFEPEYQIIKGKKKTVDMIKNSVKSDTNVYLAMDEDREGEAIGWHIIEALSLSKEKDRIERIVFHEITEEAIRESVTKPRKLNMDLVDAQQARRILDRIVGYKISPLLSKKIRTGLSAGRVQSVGLRMIVEREKERQSFKVQDYYSIEGDIKKDNNPLHVTLIGKSGKKFAKLHINSQEQAVRIINEITDHKVKVVDINSSDKLNRSPAPFITSTLQQEAFNRLSFNPSRTMSLAQQLYEGIELGEGVSMGLITYMRTDSFTIARSALNSVRKHIKDNFGKEYLPEKPNRFRSRKTAQEAHECIRPTSVEKTPETIKGFLSNDQYKLYKLIWSRFVACQMQAASIRSTSVDFNCNDYDLKASGQLILFEGYTKVWPTKINESEIPVMEKGEEYIWDNIDAHKHQTKPPARYTPATLVSEMEKRGIGRPSTYAAILKTLMQRKYITLEKGSLIPEEIAIVVTDALIEYFTGIMKYEFTAKMETDLDKVAEGKKDWKSMLSDFYVTFNSHFESAKTNMKRLKDTETDMKCPDCGRDIVIRWGRNGKFYACSGYPDCKQTFSIDTENIDVEKNVDYKCPKCGSKMVQKVGRYGKFLACSAYPKCKTTFAVDESGAPILPPILKCELCGKETVIRMSRRGSFLACTGYPKCKFTMDLEKAEKKNA